MTTVIKTRKQFILEQDKISAGQKIVNARTDTEAITAGARYHHREHQDRNDVPVYQGQGFPSGNVYGEQPSKLILDTSIYIPFINDGVAHPIIDFPRWHPIFS